MISEEYRQEQVDKIVEQFNKMRINQLKASVKWSDNNKDKVCEYSKRYYDKHKDEEDFKKKRSERSKAYYQKKKENKQII